MRYTPQGAPVTQFSLASTRQWKQDGEDKKETIWVNITTWGKMAENCANLKKGQMVFVKGYLKPDPNTGSPRVYSRNDGTAGASYDVTAQEVWLSLFGKQGSEQPASAGAGDWPPSEEDIPF